MATARENVLKQSGLQHFWGACEKSAAHFEEHLPPLHRGEPVGLAGHVPRGTSVRKRILLVAHPILAAILL